MRVLVTGATGHLGAHVVAGLLRAGDAVIALVRPGDDDAALADRDVARVEGDLRDRPSLARACRGVDALVHCAQQRGTGRRREAEQRAVNVEGTASLLRAATAAGLSRIVHVSTTAAVALSREPVVLDESAHWNGAAAGIAYASTKREAEDRAFAAARGHVPVVVVNPAVLFGPRLDGRPPSAFVREACAGRLRRVPPGGVCAADVEDVALGVVAALHRGRVNERYILGGHNLGWLELASALALAAGRPPPRGTWPAALRAPLLGLAGVAALAGLERPRWAPERFRAWGVHGWFDSSKAARELGYRIRPLPELVARAAAEVRA